MTRVIEVSTPGPQGPPGPTGPAGGGASINYLHTQSSPSSVWTVNHNMGFRPSVELFTTGWYEMVADVVHVSENQFLVYCNAPTTGYARAN